MHLTRGDEWGEDVYQVCKERCEVELSGVPR